VGGATHQHHHHGHGAGEDWHAAVHDVILPEALRGVDLGDDVLEIGPGPGLTTEVLAARAARLTTVELDAAQASALAERLAGTNVDVVEGDAAALPFADRRFSAAASFHMLHHVGSEARQDQVFAELARVLVRGGVLVAADGVPTEGSVLFGELERHHPLDPADLPRRLRQAGVVDVEVRHHDLGGWVCTARAG
jgi:SAM-dependent methyltransferase